MKQQDKAHRSHVALDVPVGGWKAAAVAIRAGAKRGVATAVALKATINPCGVSGGFSKEGNL